VNPDLPQIPDHVFKFTDYGANGDGKTMNTDAFNKAIAAIATAGGGQLDVPAGVYLTLPFSLTSKMDLHLEAGAVIQFPDSYEAYGLAEPSKATQDQRDMLNKNIASLIQGHDLTDVAITGSGTIDGAGSTWWGTRGNSFGNSRPKLIILTNVTRLHVTGVTLQNSPMWQLVPTLCQDVLIEDIHVKAPPNGPNTDAIDPNGCSNVLIRRCDLDIGDDNVAIKAIPGPCFNILVEDCKCLHGHGISIGSETFMGIHDVTVRNCTFNGTANGIRIKSARDRGNQLYNFAFSNIQLTDVPNAITLNMYYMDKAGSANRVEKPVTEHTPYLRNVRIEHVKISGAKVTCEIIGLPESPIKDVTLDDVQLAGDKGINVQDAQGVVFTNVTVTPTTGEPLISNHADVKWDK
jgi:polygalacturonase